MLQTKAAFKSKKTLFTSRLDLHFRKKLVKCYIWSTALYGAEILTFRKTDKKYLESFEMWYWRNVEIIWTDRVRNEELLQRVKERNILHKKKRRKANWNVHALRRNCFLKHVIDGTTEVGMEVMVRQGRRRKQLLHVLMETRGYRK
jgi:hypothetical protein